MGRPEIYKDGEGTRFSAENQPPNRGRKPKLFSELSAGFKARGIEEATPDRVREAFQYLLSLTLDEVAHIAGSDDEEEVPNDYPAILRIAAGEMTGRRRREILVEMLDRAHGKSTQKNEQVGSIVVEGLGVMSVDDAAALAAVLQKIRQE